MTNKKLIAKMLAKGFTRSAIDNHYGKNVNGLVVDVNITEAETISEGWRMPYFRLFKDGQLLDSNCYWTAGGLNQALCKRNVF